MIDQAPEFVKGHGTENDFVVLFDREAVVDLTPARVRALCDRHRGLGADGVLRVVPTELSGEVQNQRDTTEWFMDYRNADGSMAEMCGNGVRVFARVLADRGLETGSEFSIATRGGPRAVTVTGDEISVDMGPAIPAGIDAAPLVAVGGAQWPAIPVWFPNPHAVAFVDSVFDAGSLVEPPLVTPAELFPDGVNVEFAAVVAENHVEFRVFERGVGETRSCGTGACAVAWAYRQRFPTAAVDAAVTVDVPGGRLKATQRVDGHWLLAGPTQMVAQGFIDPQWWKDNV
ncbi:MAG TPA: diaminopimelate epimerase [Actinomycetes bacterium]|nr:diaminopimelate epimerase [Actinomycetes bacterium]